MRHPSRSAPSLVLALLLAAPAALAQDAPPPPSTPEPPQVEPAGRAASAPAPVLGTLPAPNTLSVREAAALPDRDMLLEAEASPADAPIIREMIRDEAVHRDRVARIRRLRELAAAQGRTDRLASLDALQERETERHEARALVARTRLSEPGFRATEGFLSRGGFLRLRQASVSRAELRGVERQDGRVSTRMREGSGSALGGARSGAASTSRGGTGVRGGGSRGGGGRGGPR